MEIWIPLFSGFAGAIIGAATSIATVWIQAQIQDKREKTKLVVDLAIKHYSETLNYAKDRTSGANVPSIEMYVHYHKKFFDLIEKDDVTKKDIENLKRKNRELFDSN